MQVCDVACGSKEKILELHRLVLKDTKRISYPNVALVADEFRSLQHQRDKVYHTYVWGVIGFPTFTFRTMSKDIHLRFGTMSQSGLYHLAKLIEKELIDNHVTELLLIVNNEPKAFFVTITSSDSRKQTLTLTFHPTH
ncbi:MAG: hypothetical protein AAB794_03500 [Patescibacteria group bacterium]